MTNTLGGLTGLAIFIIIGKTFNNQVNTQKFINIIAVTGTIIMILLLALLKMNMLPIRYQ
jgi:MFS-type transporter involved in bile tolerance (Atg22 family)